MTTPFSEQEGFLCLDQIPTGIVTSVVGRVVRRSDGSIVLQDYSSQLPLTDVPDDNGASSNVLVRAKVIAEQRLDGKVLHLVSWTTVARALYPWDHFRLEDVPSHLTSVRASQEAIVRERLRLRSEVSRLARGYFHSNGFVEVETPILRMKEDPTDNPLFLTDCSSLHLRLNLRTSPEEMLRRTVLVHPRVFELGRSFRNESLIDSLHTIEFTQIEFYEAFASYAEAMDRVEDMVSFVVQSLFDTTSLTRRSGTIDFARPWRRLTAREAFDLYGDIPLDKWITDHLGLEKALRAQSFSQYVDERIKPRIEQPTFLSNAPTDVDEHPDVVDPETQTVMSAQLVCAYPLNNSG